MYDPKVDADQIRLDFRERGFLEEQHLKFEDYITIEADPYKAAQGAHAIAILTEWDEFAGYDYQRMYQTMAKPAFVFDGRNILNHSALRAIGFEVHAIGKNLLGTNISMDM